LPKCPSIEEQLTTRLAIYPDGSFISIQCKVFVNINSAEGRTISVDKYLGLGYFDFGHIDYSFRAGDL
jgi:hypothetical protein